ncbi:MAG: hypothetical protein HUU37_01135 [Bdellovibrionales bacterium]|nr:hypothetical protein [Bdellovibrionales bacterium]
MASDSKNLSAFALAVTAGFALFISSAEAEEGKAPRAPRIPSPYKLYNYESCNWLVTYRGNTYDLAPLTRESLSRPVEGDLRAVLERVPEAEEHLKNSSREVRAAKFHSVLGTTAVMLAVGSRLAYENSKSLSRDTRQSLNIVSIASVLFFLKATHAAFESTRESREELAAAVNAFNEKSPHRIEPAENP